MNLYWLEQVEVDVPTGNAWLSPWEISRLNALRLAKRRADWRLGRWTAKQAAAVCLNLKWDDPTLARVEIRPAVSGTPEAFVNCDRAPLAISLSHREGRAMCAIAHRDVKLGCDLETIEPRSDAFISDYFTPEEQRVIQLSSVDDRGRTVSLLWSAKESALKALHEGLRLDTRTVNASFNCESLSSEGWGTLRVLHGCEVFTGWWQETDHLVRTIVADTVSRVPIRLPVASLAERCFVSELSALR